MMADLQENHSYKVIISTAVSFTIATLALVLRLFSRWLMRKRLEVNDYLIIVAYVPKLGIDVASVLLIIYGIGQHIITLSPENVTNYLKVVYSGSFLYAPCIAFIKLSILSLYWVAFPFRYMRVSALVIGGIVTVWGLALCLVGLLQCLPIRKAWQPLIEGTCIDTYAYYYGLQIPNIVTDVIILVLPFKAVFDLKLDKSKTIQLLAVFTLAIVTCIFDIVRLVVFIQTPNNQDITWNQVAASMWTDLEPSVAFLVACLPIMRPLLHPIRYWKLRNERSQDEDETSFSYSIEESPEPKKSSNEDTYEMQSRPHAL